MEGIPSPQLGQVSLFMNGFVKNCFWGLLQEVLRIVDFRYLVAIGWIADVNRSGVFPCASILDYVASRVLVFSVKSPVGGVYVDETDQIDIKLTNYSQDLFVGIWNY